MDPSEELGEVLERVLELSLSSDASVVIGSTRTGDAAETSASRFSREVGCRVDVLRSAQEVVDALAEGRADAAVRGTLPAHGLLSRLLEVAGLPSAGRVALMGGGSIRPFLLAPVGIDEGGDMGERWSILRRAVELARDLGAAPRVAVMSMGREEDVDRGEAIALSVRECEALRSAAEAHGIGAECVGIRLERAVGSADVVLAPDGVAGNLVFRALHLVGDIGSWGALATAVLPTVVVDSSRERRDFKGPIHLARAVASVK